MNSGASTVGRYAVVGNPVGHSQSPFIHAMFAQQTGEPVRYGRLLSPLDGFATTVADFAAGRLLAVGDGDSAGESQAQPIGAARGCNVTVPFKFEALAVAATATPRAVLAEAANTLRFDAEGWLADNTDGVGLVRDIESNGGRRLARSRVLLVGAGGAAAGVLGPLIGCHPAELVVVNRSAEKAAALIARHAALARSCGCLLRTATLGAPGVAFDLVVNATASSLQGAAVPVPATVLGPAALAVDLMYGQAALPFLEWAAQHGAQGRDGLGMLVEQAAEAFYFWRGVRPKTAGVLAALRRRLAAAS